MLGKLALRAAGNVRMAVQEYAEERRTGASLSTNEDG
jgi:hypothetical protein